MKWRTKESKLYARLGETRVVKRFALLPKTFNGERRWMEFYYMKQKLTQMVITIYIGSIPDGYKWIDDGFCDKGGQLEVPLNLKAEVLAKKITGREI